MGDAMADEVQRRWHCTDKDAVRRAPCSRLAYNEPMLTGLAMLALARLPGAGRLSAAQRIVAAAHAEVADRAAYTPGYFRIAYPGGDLPRNQGVCTDVVIRALRGAGYDLQELIHEDISRHFSIYPRREAKPDANIDHRRVPNQMCFFHRFGRTLTIKVDAPHRAEWRPGDFVFWKLPSGLDHAGVVSDTIGPSGWPMVVHNLEVCREEDVLTAWKIQGHYRYPR